MTRNIIPIIAMVLIFHGPTFAAATLNPGITACSQTTCTGNETYVNMIGCKTNIKTTCYGNQYAVSSCTACDAGMGTLTSLSISVPCGPLVSYNDCFESCSSDADCGTATDYTCSAGYCQQRVPKCGSNKRCTTRTEYACDTGFYGQTSDGTSGCTRCAYASEFGRAGDTAGIGTATTQDDCYIPSDATFRVSSGTGIITNNCYYQS